MTPSRHEELSALLGPAALGLLTSVEQQQLDRHVQSCATCREELAALRGVAGRLGALDLDDAVRADLGSSPARTEAVMADIGRARAQEHRRAFRLQAVLGAAASVAVLLAGLVTGGAMGDAVDPVPTEAVAVSAQDGVQASADLVAHTWGVEIKLAATGFAPGQPYTVQVTTTEGDVADAGAFIGTGDRAMTCNLNTSVLRPDAESFTVLDADGRPVVTADL